MCMLEQAICTEIRHGPWNWLRFREWVHPAVDQFCSCSLYVGLPRSFFLWGEAFLSRFCHRACLCSSILSSLNVWDHHLFLFLLAFEDRFLLGFFFFFFTLQAVFVSAGLIATLVYCLCAQSSSGVERPHPSRQRPFSPHLFSLLLGFT